MNILSTKKVLAGALVVLGLSMTSTLTGCLTDDKKDAAPDTSHHTAWGTSMTANLGAQAHPTLGSVLDLDSGKVWLSAVANQNQAKIDLVYLYYNSAAHLDGARAARDSGAKYTINLTNTYDTTKVKDIMMVKVTAKPADQEAGITAYTAGPLIRSTTIAIGDKFVVKTTEGKYAYVEIAAVAGTTAGTADVSFIIGSL